MMLNIEDGVNVAMDYIKNHCDDYDLDEEDRFLLYQEMEQKCWISDFKDDDALKNLVDLLIEINPTEICIQINHDHLNEWCKNIQVEMQLNLIKLKRGNDK